MSRQKKREMELEEENKILRAENALLKEKLQAKRNKLVRSSENLLELAEKRAVEILRAEERFNIVVNISNGGIMNFSDSPIRAPIQHEDPGDVTPGI